MNPNLFNWDELKILRGDAIWFIREAKQKKPTKEEIDRFCDYMEFVLCLIYDYGWKDAEQIIGAVSLKDGLDDRSVNAEIDGLNFRERVEKQIDDLSEDGLIRIIDTESHRDYNTGVYDAGKQSGKPNLRKRWNTMMDDEVRDPHAYMEGMTVGLDDLFYTYTGDSTLYPGGFGVPDLDINCRCWVTLAE